MAEPLFYSERLGDPGATLTLTGDEAHHAAASRRLQPGDRLWVFNGRGEIARATLLRSAERGRRLELRVEERRAEPAPRRELHLACALPKGERQSVLLDMATQLGMTRFTPLACERAVVKPGAHSEARWKKICLEACKQSRRLFLPVIDAPAALTPVCTRAAAQGASLWIAHPAAHAVPLPAAARNPGTNNLTLLIGPEGGFTDEEVRLAVAQGARIVALGTTILRIETAALALLAAFGLAAGSGAA